MKTCKKTTGLVIMLICAMLITMFSLAGCQNAGGIGGKECPVRDLPDVFIVAPFAEDADGVFKLLPFHAVRHGKYAVDAASFTDGRDGLQGDGIMSFSGCGLFLIFFLEEISVTASAFQNKIRNHFAGEMFFRVDF